MAVPENKWKLIFESICRNINLFKLVRKKHQFQEQMNLQEDDEPEEWTNPYLADSRNFIEQILEQKCLDYRRFRPIVLDTDCPGQNFGEEDDVDQVLEQLVNGLNFLEICTDRPEYFETLKDCMERENGLLIRILPKHGAEKKYGNMVLDFERGQPLWMDEFSPQIIYLPFYKRKWLPADDFRQEKTEKNHTKTAQNKENTQRYNLDIEVPIGYNMLIVRKNISSI